ncbi:MAG: 50S ribosomal protein L13 [Chlamydiales bacterium]
MQRKKETTTTLIKKEAITRSWYLFNAEGKILGHFCAEIARVLRGKHKPIFTPNLDMGDGVIVVNADKILVSGNKEGQKNYQYYTGHIGGQRIIPYRNIKERKPEYIITHAVKGMMPKSRLGKQQLRKLRVFAGAEHPYQAQKPIKADI